MNRRFLISALLVVTCIQVVSGYVMAYGVDLSFPAARRFVVTQGYSTGHQAHDYGFPNHISVVAAKTGTVNGFRWDFADNNNWFPCRNNIDDRGNYIILDHGGGVETRYYHLSNTGSQPGVGTSFDRGDSMALSNDTGCSSGPHLHFALYVGGSARDPYASPGEWIAGSPLPMGYRDQNGTAHGPYAIDYSSIHSLWEGLEGEPGSPLGDDYRVTAVQEANNPLSYIRTQPFEHGTLVFETGYGTTYYPYAETYLPDIRADKNANGWKSILVIRNNGNHAATVNVTFYARDGFFTGSGHVLESRTHTAVPARGVWVVDTRNVLLDYLNEIYGIYPNIFEGSATVYASQDVSVVVMNIHRGTPYVTGSYVGIDEPATILYLPRLQRNNNGMHSDFTVFNTGSATTQIQVQYIPESGYSGCTTGWIKVPPHGSYKVNMRDNPNCWLGGTFVGGAKVRSQNEQPLAAVANHWRDWGSGELEAFMSYEAMPHGHLPTWLPLLQQNNNNWYTSSGFQNTASYIGAKLVTLNYVPEDQSEVCQQQQVSLDDSHVVSIFPSPPSGPCWTSQDKFVGSAKVTRGGYEFSAVVFQEEFESCQPLFYLGEYD